MSRLMEQLLLEGRVQNTHTHTENFLVADSTKKDGSGRLRDPAIKLGLWIANESGERKKQEVAKGCRAAASGNTLGKSKICWRGFFAVLLGLTMRC